MDQAFAMAQCRPDMDAASCRSCITKASKELTTICSNTKEAIGGYEEENNYCMLRYANRSIFNHMENAPYFFVYNPTNYTGDEVAFKQARDNLLDKLIIPAAAGNSRNKSASGEVIKSSNLTVYAYVQCTPDLTEAECSDCLGNATSRLPQCCDINPDGRVIYPSCNFRYAINPILTQKPSLTPQAPATNAPPAAVAPSDAPSTGKGTSRNVNTNIICVSVAALAILLISSIYT
ncbi:hypothetical protein ACFE04_002849 [Oxalis oulophora]